MNTPGARIVFAGSPDFAVPGLRALARRPDGVIAVLTQPDRPAGRGRRVEPGPVKRVAAELGVPVLQPPSLRDPGAQAQLRALAPDLLVVIAYGQLLPPSVLAIPRHGCLNVHASLLPRWRGASPIQAAVLAGDAESGVTLMRMEAGLDTGPVFAAARTAIGPRETAGELHDRLSELGAQLLQQYLDDILAGALMAQPQPEEGVTYAGRIDKADAVIDWTAPALTIDRLIRAYNPWPVAETLLDGQRLRCWAAEPVPGKQAGAPGCVAAATPEGLLIVTGRGLLRLTSVQLPGRQRMAAADLARGHAVLGKVLGG